MAGRVLTVLGPVDPEALGHTLMHEHVFIDFTNPDDEPERWTAAGRSRPATATASRLYHAPLTLDILGSVMLGAMNRDNWLLTDEAQQTREVAEFARAGGGTLVDVTSIGLGRKPEALVRVARASGLHVVMGSSWYARAWHPKDLDERGVESLADEIVRDVTVGVDGTGIRAGIIGEVGAGGNLDSGEGKVLRASARASRRTGAAITVHVTSRQHARILDVLAEEGADLSRVVLGHSDLLPSGDVVGYVTPLLERGATVEFDLLGKPPLVTRRRPLDSEVAQTIVGLVKAGYGDRILLSHDVCTKTSLKAYGGTGYSFVEERFLPYLKRQGLSDAQIEQLVVENPKRLLTFVAPRD